MNEYEKPPQNKLEGEFKSDYEKKVATRYNELGKDNKFDLDIWGNALYKDRAINFYNDKEFINEYFTAKINEIGRDKITVADFGGAEGHVLDEISQKLESEGIEVLPINIDREVKAIENRSKNLSGLPADLKNLPISENKIDAGIIRFTLPYNNKENEEKILSEVYKALKDGGRVIIMQDGAYNKELGDLYNEFFAQASAAQCGETIEEIKENRCFLSGEEIKEMAEKIGFKVVEAREIDETEGYLSPKAYKSRFSMTEEQYKNLEQVFADNKEKNSELFEDERMKRPIIYLVLEK